jgi:excisionase family DNA binding protein
MDTQTENSTTKPVVAPGVPLAVAAEIAAYLDLNTAAAAVDVTRQTMKEWIRDGLVPTYRLGHKFVRIKASDLLALYQPEPTTVPHRPEPPKRGPGRPRKHPVAVTGTTAEATT